MHPSQNAERRSRLVPALIATLVALVTSSSEASTCGRDPGDDDAVEASVTAIRAACPCDSFRGRGSFRRCARDRIKAAVTAGGLPSRCRATVIRAANRATSGDASSAVACCFERSTECTIARSAIACRAWRGGRGLVGKTDWCHDSCPTDPTPRPATPTPFPTATPTPLGEPTPPPPPTPTPMGGLVGYSGIEFSATQGRNHWYYGTYPDAPQSFAFVPMTDFEPRQDTPPGRWWADRENSLASITPVTQRAAGETSSCGRTATGDWVVRRWVSFITSDLRITGLIGNDEPGSDGAVAYVIIDGQIVLTRVLQPDDQSLVPYFLLAHVTVGSTVDFVVSANGGDCNDTVQFSAIIEDI